jgi:hypothetical protein
MPYLAHKHLIYDPTSGRLIYDPTSGHLIKAGEQTLFGFWASGFQKYGTSTVDKATAIANMEADAWTGSYGAFTAASSFGSRWTFYTYAMRFDTNATWDGGVLGQYLIPEGASASIIFLNLQVTGGRLFRLGFTTTASATPVTAFSWITAAPYVTVSSTGLARLEFPAVELERYFWMFLYFDDASAALKDDICEPVQISGSLGRIVG